MPQSPTYLTRMQRVLEARVEQKKTDETPRLQRLRQASASILGAVAVFYVLKAAAMAAGGPLIVAPTAQAGIGASLTHWILGPDPVSSALAMAMQGGATPL